MKSELKKILTTKAQRSRGSTAATKIIKKINHEAHGEHEDKKMVVKKLKKLC